MWFVRPAKSWHKLFQMQFLLGTKIKTTYGNVLTTKHMNLGPKCKTRVSFDFSSFGSKAKMCWFGFFQTSYKFPGRYLHLLRKKLFQSPLILHSALKKAPWVATNLIFSFSKYLHRYLVLQRALLSDDAHGSCGSLFWV